MIRKLNIDFNKNLESKESLIKKLKELINVDMKMSEKYTQFKLIQQEWFEIGPVPRNNRSIIWNNFQHHIKNFYDYLYLNRKFKKIDVQYNIKKKEELIKQAKELINYENPIKSFKDFQRISRKWKYEIGPTTKEADLKFDKNIKEIEKKIILKREDFENNKESIFIENLNKKKNLLEKIKILNSKECIESKEWKRKIVDFEKIKDLIEKSGPIPFKEKKIFWKNYKEIIKNFYKKKNIFFKNLKSIYRENIIKQQELIKKIEDLDISLQNEKKKMTIIELQKKWKKIKPVPFKINKKNFQRFNSLCNIAYKKVANEITQKVKETKKTKDLQIKFISEIDNIDYDKKIDLEELIKKWNEFDLKNEEIQIRFEKTIIKVLKKSGFQTSDAEKTLFDYKYKFMTDDQKSKEILIINKELNILQKEYANLNNNLSFFNEKSKENKLLNKVHSNIKNINYKIEYLKSQIIKLKS